LLLARLRPGHDRRDPAGTRPDGAAATRLFAARPLRRGVRRADGTAPRELPAGVLASCADRGGGEDHHPRAARGVLSGPGGGPSSRRADGHVHVAAGSRPSQDARSFSSACTAFVTARANFTSSWIAFTRSTPALRSAIASTLPTSRSP